MNATTRPTSYRARNAIPLSALIVAVTAGIVNALVAVGAVALGAEATGGLQPLAYLALTVIAAIAGAVGWHLINRATRHPAEVMRWLVPAFLIASFVPDFLVSAAVGWLTTSALMLMHITTIAIAVPVYIKIMPLRPSGSREDRTSQAG